MLDFITAIWATITEWLTRVWSAATDLIGAIPGIITTAAVDHPTITAALAFGTAIAIIYIAAVLTTRNR